MCMQQLAYEYPQTESKGGKKENLEVVTKA